MDFAKRLLNKYGWKDGDGLGKNNKGIEKPLKAVLKFDNAGFGVDRATEFNNHWWNRAYNDAARNVDVKKQDDGQVKFALNDADDAVEISTKSYSAKKLKRAKQRVNDNIEESGLYQNFLKSSTLTQAGCEVDQSVKVSMDDIEVTQVKILTDEELFRACGGRTAHKGARHGLKLSGKLARLEKQEQELLAKMQLQADGDNLKSSGISKIDFGSDVSEVKDDGCNEIKPIKKKKSKQQETLQKPLQEDDVLQKQKVENEEHKPRKKKKSKQLENGETQKTAIQEDDVLQKETVENQEQKPAKNKNKSLQKSENGHLRTKKSKNKKIQLDLHGANVDCTIGDKARVLINDFDEEKAEKEIERHQQMEEKDEQIGHKTKKSKSKRKLGALEECGTTQQDNSQSTKRKKSKRI